MFKKITTISVICISGLWGASSHAGVIYDINSTLNIGGQDFFGSGFVDVSPAALTANNEIVFSSGSILDFGFSFEGVIVSILNSSSPTTEGFRTDATGEVIAFVDTSGTFADFRTFFDPSTGLQRGVFFSQSNFQFNASTDSTAGSLATGGTYSITRRVDPDPTPVPVPPTLVLFGLGLAGLSWSKRKKAQI